MEKEEVNKKLIIIMAVITAIVVGIVVFIVCGGDELIISKVNNENKTSYSNSTSNKNKEKRNTKLLNASRRIRIAKGSGTTVQDINKFIKSYEMTQKMMKQMKSKGGMKKFMNGIDENALKNFKI